MNSIFEYFKKSTKNENLILEAIHLVKENKIQIEEVNGNTYSAMTLNAKTDENKQYVFFSHSEFVFRYSRCTCEDFKKQQECAHIMAAIIAAYVEYELYFDIFKEEDLNPISNQRFKIKNEMHKIKLQEDLQNLFKVANKNKIKGNFICEIQMKSKEFTIRLKISEKNIKPLYVSNVNDFLSAYNFKKKYEISKSKSIDFENTEFSLFENEILENIGLIKATGQYVKGLSRGEFMVSLEGLMVLLKIYEKHNKKIPLKINNDLFHVKYSSKNIISKLVVTENGNDYQIKLDQSKSKIKLLLPFIFDEKFENMYFPKPNEIKILNKLLVLNEMDENINIPILKEQVLNILNNEDIKSEVILPKSITKDIIIGEIQPILYITKENSIFTLTLNYKYNAFEFNPKLPLTKLVNRDFTKEKYFASLLKNIEHLEDYDELLDFINIEVPILKEAGIKILLDEKIKNLHFVKPKVNINVRLLEGGLLNVSFEIDEIEKKDLMSALKNYKLRNKFIELKNGGLIDLRDEENLKNLEKLNELEYNGENEMEVPMYNLFKLSENEFINVENEIIQIKKEILEITKKPDQIAKNLENILRPYQLLGVYWFQQLSKHNLGGILADDMGLGKTLQTIAFISSLKENKKILIIAPKTLIYNWQKEFEKFAPNIQTLIISGSSLQRKELIKNNQNQILITSYPLVSKDLEFYDFEFSHIFIDEAQQIKTPSTLIAKAVKSLKAKHRFALTGTPLENNLLELWSIFDFIMPGFLGNQKTFTTNVVKNMHDFKMFNEFKHQISPFILRRLKSVVLQELPEKIQTPIFCEMGKEQTKIYNHYFMQTKKELAIELQENGFSKSRIKILALLTRLRQICIHPSLFLENYEGESTKLDVLEEIINEAIEGNHKILLFSQFTSMLAIIREKLIKQKIKFEYLNGQTPALKRMEMVENFNEKDSQIFLLSLKAGGTGLNLTAADIVIHFDPWWNPSVENQATDRAHRFGQENTVQVFQFVAKNTIEEKILELKEKKQELFNNLFDNQEAIFESINEDEIKSLFE